MKDKIVEEVRKHRLAHTRKFKGDLSAICDDLLRIQLESGHKIVRLNPKKLTTTTRSSARANKSGDCGGVEKVLSLNKVKHFNIMSSKG